MSLSPLFDVSSVDRAASINRLRIVQTIASTRHDHGGTSRSVPALCNALVERDVDNFLLTAQPADSRVACLFPNDRSRVRLAHESARFRQWGIGSQFRRELSLLAEESQSFLVHDHAVWLPSNHAVARFCRQHSVRRIVSPRGMLTPWALNHGKWKKRIAWWVFQRADLMSASVLHATSELEASELRELGLHQPIAIIPNGVDTPSLTQTHSLSKGSKQALFIGRIHPKKGLPMLAAAWAALKPAGWRMHVIGPDEGGHRAEVERAVQQLGIAEQWFFHDSVEGDSKWEWLSKVDVTILPTYSENFGLTVVESLLMGTPVITTTGAPWSKLVDNRCGWWVEPTPHHLQQALENAFRADPLELKEMGRRGATWVKNDFTWDGIAEKFEGLYRWLATGGVTPKFLNLSGSIGSQ